MESEPVPRETAVHVSPDCYQLITSGAHFLHVSKRELVMTAVEYYLNSRRDEMEAGMVELLSQLAGRPAD